MKNYSFFNKNSWLLLLLLLISGFTFGQTNTWDGSSNTNWNRAANWSQSRVPSSTDDVVIANVTRKPVIGNFTAVVKSIAINSGSSLTLNNVNSKLNISGDFENNGNIIANANSTVSFIGNSDASISGLSQSIFANLVINKTNSSNSLTNSDKAFAVTGNLTVTQGNLILTATDESYIIGNNLTVSSTGTLTHSVDWDATGKLILLSGNLDITGGFSYSGVLRSHIQLNGINKTIRTGIAELSILTLANTSGTIAANGSVIVNDNFWPSFNTVGGTFATGANMVTAKSSVLVAGGTLLINGGTLNVIGGLNDSFGTFNGVVNLSSGTLNADGLNIGSDTNTGTFNHSGGVANIGNLTINTGSSSYATTGFQTINISGNWINNNVFTAGSSTVNFVGTSAQAINGNLSGVSGRFFNVTFNGVGGIWTNNAPMEIANTLTMTNGILNTTSTNIVNVTSTANSAISGGSSTSYVNGPIKWNMPANLTTNSVYQFPVGKGTNFYPFSLVNPKTKTTPPTTATVEAFNEGSGGSGGNSVVNSLSSTEYWSLGIIGEIFPRAVSLSRPTPIAPYNIIRGSDSKIGSYNYLGGTISGTSSIVNSVNTPNYTFFAFGRNCGNLDNNILSYSNGSSGSVSSTTAENGTASFSAPAGTYFSTINFASYGNPTGTSPNFSIDNSKHSAKSQLIVENYLLGKSTPPIINFLANNGIFGDSNFGAAKSLVVVASYEKPICPGQSISITGSTPTGTGPYTYLWESSTTSSIAGFAAASGTNTGINYTSAALTGTTWFRRTVNSCSISNIVLVKVDPIKGGTVNTAQTICSGTAPANLTLSGQVGTVEKWQKATNLTFTTGVVDIANTTTTLTGSSIGNLTTTTYFRAVVKNGTCTLNSAAVMITVDPVSVGGTVTGGTTICSGSTSVLLTLAGNTGTVVRWESSVNPFSSWTTIANTSTTYTSGALTQTTQFRAVVQSGVCSTANSATTTVTVNPITVAGTVSGGTTICSGSTSGLLTLTGNTGNVVRWESSVSPFSSWTTIANTNTTYTSNSLTQTTQFRAVVQSGVCGILNSTATTITVNPNLPASVIIATNVSPTICPGTSVTFTATPTNGGTNPTYQWKLNGTDIIGATAAIYTSSTLLNGNKVTVALTSNATPCSTGSPATSNEITIINQTTVYNGSWSIPPAPNLSAEIRSSYNLSSDLNVCSLLVTNNAPVTIKSGNYFSIQNGINVESGSSLTVESDANLLQINKDAVNVGDIIAQRAVVDLRNIPGTAVDYVYWSSPVSGQKTKGAGGFSPGTPNNRFYTYRESNDRFYETGDLTFVPGKGYAVRAEGNQGPSPFTAPYDKTYEFKGIPNNGDISLDIIRSIDNPVGTVHGFNMVGNPYPSNISFDELHAGNSTLIYNTAYFWTNASFQQSQQGSGYGGNNYAIYNGTGGSPATAPVGYAIPNGIIKVGQGFIVQKVDLGTAPLLFKNSFGGNNLRVSDAGTFYQKGVSDKNRFWLSLLAPSQLVNTQLVGYVAGATDGFEQDYDAEAFDNYSDLFYSILPAKKLVIQGKGANFSDEDKVMLGANFFQNGSYTIALDKTEGIFANGQNIYLKDKQTGIVTNLSQGSYPFIAAKGDHTGRFEIIYKPETVLATDTKVKEQIVVYRDADNFVIKSPKVISQVEVYDGSGKLTVVLKPNNTTAILEAATLPNGVYILKIKTKDGDSVARKIVR